MKYLLLNGPRELEIADKEIPAVKDDLILIKVECCGFCGTDYLIYSGQYPARFPYSPGHEYVGIITALGKTSKDFKVGDRVTVDPNFYCGSCFYCRKGEVNLCENQKNKVKSNGGFAEYVAVPATMVYKIPRGISAEEAVFTETISCCLHAADKSEIRHGENVFILGAGTVGLVILQLVKGVAGKVMLSEPVEFKREIASGLGADLVIDPFSEDVVSRIRKETNGYGVDRVIDCSGKADALRSGVKTLRRGGTLILSALYPSEVEFGIRPLETIKNEVTIKGVFLNPFTYERSIEILANHRLKLKPLITQKYKLEEVSKAYETFSEGEAIKIIIEP